MTEMEHHIVLKPEVLGFLGPLPITNTLLVSWVVIVFLAVISIFATSRMKAIPSGLQNFFEVVIEQGYQICEDLAGQKAKVFFPIVFTFFLFIITANWFGLFPGFATVGFWEEHEIVTHEQTATPVEEHAAPVDDHGVPTEHSESTEKSLSVPAGQDEPHTQKTFVPLLRSINSDLNMTLALALISAVVTHAFAIKYLSLMGYLKRWFSLQTFPVFIFVGFLEIVSEFTKVVSLSFRLFGNIFAGEVVLATVAGIFAFLVPLPFYFLEIIVGFVQAAVFMMLSLVFMVLLSEKHAEEH